MPQIDSAAGRDKSYGSYRTYGLGRSCYETGWLRGMGHTARRSRNPPDATQLSILRRSSRKAVAVVGRAQGGEAHQGRQGRHEEGASRHPCNTQRKVQPDRDHRRTGDGFVWNSHQEPFLTSSVMHDSSEILRNLIGGIPPWMWLALAFVFIFLIFKALWGSKFKGWTGEKMVSHLALRKLDRATYQVFDDLYLPRPDGREHRVRGIKGVDPPCKQAGRGKVD